MKQNRIEYKVYVRKEYIQPHALQNNTVAIFERTQKERKRKFAPFLQSNTEKEV